MARKAREISKSGNYYITLKGDELFVTDEDKKMFVEILEKNFATGIVHSYYLTKSEIRLVVKEGEKGISMTMKPVTTSYARYFNRTHEREGKLFADRFKSVNLSGKSYGFCYENADEVALVFAEHLEVPTASILFELAQVFPQYKVYLEGTQIKMAKVDFDEEVLEELTPETQLLSRVTKLKGNVIKLASFNQDELVELLSQYKGQTVYYDFAQRECLAYIVQK